MIDRITSLGLHVENELIELSAEKQAKEMNLVRLLKNYMLSKLTPLYIDACTLHWHNVYISPPI